MSLSANTEEYRSGDPSLAFVDDEAEKAPTFDDPYEERKYVKHRLALGFRVLAISVFAEGVAGHVTVRDPVDPNSFWVNPFGLHFSLIRDEDPDSRRIMRRPMLFTQRYTRLALNVLCAAHSHSTYGRAFCATGRTLDMLTQDFCVFWNDHILWSNFAGLVLAPAEGNAIAATLGTKKAALLGNHGIMTVGPTIEATIAWFVLLERCCQIQLLADASSAGSGKPLLTIGEHEAKSTWEAVGTTAMDIFRVFHFFRSQNRSLMKLCA
ncbi:class II aldolase/adducin domain protein [Fusarium oxysporum]|nr:class II aldolase/adducin domain protein [Fusarium oxysporum]